MIGIYKNILDSNEKKVTIKHDRFDSFTKNLLLWKLRDYNEKTVTFINNLLSLESACKRDINNESRQELSEYIVKTFISSEVNNKILKVFKNNLSQSQFSPLKILRKLMYNGSIIGSPLSNWKNRAPREGKAEIYTIN